MRADLRHDLTAALKARNRVAVAALRSALAAIENAEAVLADHPLDGSTGNEHVAGLGATEVERRHLTDADLRSIVENEMFFSPLISRRELLELIPRGADVDVPLRGDARDRSPAVLRCSAQAGAHPRRSARARPARHPGCYEGCRLPLRGSMR